MPAEAGGCREGDCLLSWICNILPCLGACLKGPQKNIQPWCPSIRGLVVCGSPQRRWRRGKLKCGFRAASWWGTNPALGPSPMGRGSCIPTCNESCQRVTAEAASCRSCTACQRTCQCFSGESQNESARSSRHSCLPGRAGSAVYQSSSVESRQPGLFCPARFLPCSLQEGKVGFAICCLVSAKIPGH